MTVVIECDTCGAIDRVETAPAAAQFAQRHRHPPGAPQKRLGALVGELGQ